MNVILKNPSYYILDIKIGDLFLFEDKIYMKTNNSFYDFNDQYHFECVELSTVVCKPLYIFTPVIPLTVVKNLIVERATEEK